MINLIDIFYSLGVGVTAPLWLVRRKAREKVRRALATRMGHVDERPGTTPAVMIHAVSLGEINATGELVKRLRLARQNNPIHFIISTTTDTGLASGQKIYGNQPDVTLVRFPLDFSWAVNRLLERLRPSVVVLMELEIWPNFLSGCTARGIPVIVINGRITTASFSRYKMIRPLVRRMFRQLRQICAQDETYAKRFTELGADPERVSVTGTMKFDTAEVADTVPGAEALAKLLTGAKEGREPLWVCGSTGPGEEVMVLDQFRKLRERFPTLRVVLVPRHPQRFDEVAGIIAAAGFDCLRRSQPNSSDAPVILGDTMGELRAWYTLADVVFVGRTLVDLGPRQHGSDMIEPAALGKAVVVGVYTANFAAPMARFVAAEAMKVVTTGGELGDQIGALLDNPTRAAALGRRARQVVLDEQGATDRHVRAIVQLL